MTVTGADLGAAGPTTRGYWWWGRRRSVALDVGLALVSALECALEGVSFAGDTGLPVPFGVLFGLLAGSVLVLRRRWPIAVVLVSIATTPAEMGFLMAIVGLYTLAASDVPRRITVVLTGMTLVGTFIVSYVRLRQTVDADADFGPGVWYVPVVSLFMSLGLTAAGGALRSVHRGQAQADGELAGARGLVGAGTVAAGGPGRGAGGVGAYGGADADRPRDA